MKLETRFMLVIGFGTLLILISFLALSAFWKAEQIYGDMSAIHDSFRRTDDALNGIHAGVYSASIQIRDFLLDPQPVAAEQYHRDFLALRRSTEAYLAQLKTTMAQADNAALDRLQKEIDAFYQARDFVFSWSPQQKSDQGLLLLRSMIPHRDDVISLTLEINKLNEANLQKERLRIDQTKADFRRWMGGVFLVTLVLALAVAGLSYYRITRLERNAERERHRIERAEQELRTLSQKLVHAQEEERRSISRELHDEIGQMLTGVRLELRNLDELRNVPGPDFADHLAETKALAEKSLRAVRELAMGLRPSMLDDLGLGPALEWQAKEFSRHNGIPATIDVNGDLEGLSDRVRTCVYRVVQESLTNCARHAMAKNVRISVHGNNGLLDITVRDDGVGFCADGRTPHGLGLVSMEERVRELGGSMKVTSGPNEGTQLDIEIPLRCAESR